MDERVVGPGLEDAIVDKPSVLDEVTNEDYVVILNPLTDAFMGKFGITTTANVPFKIRQSGIAADTQSEADVRRNYGTNLKNTNHQGKVHIQNQVKIPAGKTIRLPGGEARVIVKQLIDHMMGVEGNGLKRHDPFARGEYEARVVRRIGSVDEFYRTGDVEVKEVEHEPEFAAFEGPGDLTRENEAGGFGNPEGSGEAEAAPVQPQKRGPGRPKSAK